MTVLLRRLLLALVFMAVPLAMWPGAARADTVASLLGDFTINQYTGIELAGGEVKLHYVAVFGQLPALRELREADANADGVTSQAERDAHVQKLAPGIAEQLSLSVGGVAVPLRALRWTSSLPTEQGGFSMRLDIDFAGALPAVASDQAQTLNFENRNYPGKIGWHEIAVSASPGVAVFDTNAFSTSLTAGLTEALKELPATGPLDERSVHLQFVTGAAPAGAQAIQARAGTAATLAAGASAATTASTEHSPVAGAAPGSAVSPWLQTQTRRLIDIISAPHVPPHILVIALLAAMVLGALHAFAPGHGKTIVGAYLVGSRGTPRHAVFLGVTVTITHTLIVFALGLVTLFASQFILPEKVFPILSLLSGLLVFGMGIVLLAQRWRGLAGGHGHDHVHPHPHPHPHDHGHGHGGHAHEHGAHGHAAHSHDAAHSHGHDHGHPPAAVAGAMHSHGGAMHSHLPPVTPGEAVSWRGLLALGVSGGLLPCPSAMVLLLAAVALHKTFYGLLLVVAFSVGLALTLTAVGLAFLYARNRFAGSLGDARWVQVLPVMSAALITGLGAVLCYGALAAGPV